MPSNIYMRLKYLHAELDHDVSVVPGVRPGPGGGLQLPPPGGQLAARCPGAPDDAQLVLVCLANGGQEPFGFLDTRPHVSYIFGMLMTNGI